MKMTWKRSLFWLLLVLVIVGDVLGFLWGLYDRIPWFDEVFHLMTTWLGTLLVAYLLYDRVLGGSQAHPVLLFLTVVILGLGLGAFWEMVEWVWFELGQQKMPEPRRDTVMDLAIDTLGAILAGLQMIRWGREEGGTPPR